MDKHCTKCFGALLFSSHSFEKTRNLIFLFSSHSAMAPSFTDFPNHLPANIGITSKVCRIAPSWSS